jgi:hypothetical protein
VEFTRKLARYRQLSTPFLTPGARPDGGDAAGYPAASDHPTEQVLHRSVASAAIHLERRSWEATGFHPALRPIVKCAGTEHRRERIGRRGGVRPLRPRIKCPVTRLGDDGDQRDRREWRRCGGNATRRSDHERGRPSGSTLVGTPGSEPKPHAPSPSTALAFPPHRVRQRRKKVREEPELITIAGHRATARAERRVRKTRPVSGPHSGEHEQHDGRSE